MRNLERNISVANLASELKVSREHLSRVFRDCVGIAPDKYITREKIKLACNLLRESSLSCKEISGRIGYESPSCFTRAFSSVVGMTPTKVRKTGHVPNFTIL